MAGLKPPAYLLLMRDSRFSILSLLWSEPDSEDGELILAVMCTAARPVTAILQSFFR
jgi:hypothetical protein